MKLIVILAGFFCFISSVCAQTRVFPQTPRYAVYDVEVGYNKTTILLFPYAVKPGDIGSPDIIAQKVKGFENAVKVKAGKTNFTPTNLSVFTSDGTLFSINLSYSDSVSQPVYVLTGDKSSAVASRNGKRSMPGLANQATIDSVAAKILDMHTRMHHPRSHSELVRAAVKGIYYAQGALFVRIGIRNKSYVPFETDFTKTEIATLGKGKRKARITEPLTPLYTYGFDEPIENTNAHDIVLVYDKFTLAHDRKLIIRLYEKQGHRGLVLAIKPKTFREARAVVLD